MTHRQTALALALVLALASPASAQGWRGFDQPDVIGTGTCPQAVDDVTGNFACFVVECLAGGALAYGVVFAGGDFGEVFDGTPVVDGRPFPAMRFQRVPTTDWLHYRATHDPVFHAPLLAALRAGSVLRLGITGAGGLRTAYPDVNLRGSSRALAPVTSACNAALAAPPAATPATRPDRFLSVSAQPPTPEAEALATRLLGATLAENAAMLGAMGAPPAQRVSAVLATWPDGRRLLLATIEHDTTAVYGQSGAGSHLFTAAPGADFTEHLRDTAFALWMDTQQATDGWPDLVIQPVQGGFDLPFSLWRWNGAAYAFAGRLS